MAAYEISDWGSFLEFGVQCSYITPCIQRKTDFGMNLVPFKVNFHAGTVEGLVSVTIFAFEATLGFESWRPYQ